MSGAGAGADGVIQRVRLGAYAWAERDAALLLVRIAPTEREAGRWTLPGGGIAFGEDPSAGMLRELYEETGLGGSVGELLGVRSAIIEPEETKSGHRIQAVGLLYRVTITGGDLRDELDESTDLAAWIPFAELDTLPQSPILAWGRGLGGR